MKRLLLISALILSACGGAEPVVDTPTPAPATNAFLDGLAKDYPVTLAPIGDDIWVHTTTYTLPGQSPIPVNGLVVVDGEGVTLVDGAWGELATVALIEKVKAETGLPVTKMVVTHHHADRTMGVDAAERMGAQVYTHPDTPNLAARAGWPVPNTSVAALKAPQSRTKLGRIELAYPGAAHARDNITVYIPDENILYAGCAVRGAESRGLGNVEDADLDAWPTTLGWLKATYPDTKLVVPGHGKGSNLSLLDATGKLVAEAKAAATDD